MIAGFIEEEYEEYKSWKLKVQEVEDNISESGEKNKIIPGLCLDVQVKQRWGDGCWNERRHTRSVWTQTERLISRIPH